MLDDLCSSEERYRALFEFIDEGFCIMERLEPVPGAHPDFRLISVNAAYERQTGIKDAVGHTLRELFPAEPDDWFQVFDQILRTGEPIRFEHAFGGGARIFDLYACRIHERASDYVAAVFADITDRKRWEAALRESEQRTLAYVKRLEQADQNKNRFLSTLSHELRNPLAAIVMSFTLLEQSTPGSEQANHYRDVIIRQTSQMKRLVDDLLDVTRISQNKLALKLEAVELTGLVRKVIDDFRNAFSDKRIALEASIPQRPLYLQGDADRLTQAIGNLLHNALKFTPEDGTVKVTLQPDGTGTQAVIQVRDNGIGMSPELMRDLFQPFTQGSMSADREQGGLGLGLAVVKGMIDQHGGTVMADSDGPGKGSVFTVQLPLLRQPVEEAKAAAEPAERDMPSLRAVIIEDNPDLQEILLQLLTMLGHEAVGAGDGGTGIARARELRPHVILCDIGLPDMSGYEVAQYIRKDPVLKSVYLVALSGYAQPEDLERSRESGFDRHLAKPVDIETLKSVLAESIDRTEAAADMKGN